MKYSYSKQIKFKFFLLFIMLCLKGFLRRYSFFVLVIVIVFVFVCIIVRHVVCASLCVFWSVCMCIILCVIECMCVCQYVFVSVCVWVDVNVCLCVKVFVIVHVFMFHCVRLCMTGRADMEGSAVSLWSLSLHKLVVPMVTFPSPLDLECRKLKGSIGLLC